MCTSTAIMTSCTAWRCTVQREFLVPSVQVQARAGPFRNGSLESCLGRISGVQARAAEHETPGASDWWASDLKLVPVTELVPLATYGRQASDSTQVDQNFGGPSRHIRIDKPRPSSSKHRSMHKYST